MNSFSNKLYLSIFCFLIQVVSPALCTVDGLYSQKVNVRISNIEIGKMDDDLAPSEFSIRIELFNEGEDIKDWLLGFYMAAVPFSSFKKGLQMFNPQIVRRICDSKGNCSKLDYVTQDSLQAPDLSQGYTTIHAPVKGYSLKKNETYNIEFLHLNRWGVASVSYFPQNFFLLKVKEVKGNGNEFEVFNLKTDFQTYNFIGYGQEIINDEIRKHIRQNWNQVLGQQKVNQTVSVVPTPVNAKIEQGFYRFPHGKINVFTEFNDESQTISSSIMKLFKDITEVRISDDITQVDDITIIIRRMQDPQEICNNPEGYVLNIGKHNIIIKAIKVSGVYYAIQTLSQLSAQAEVKNKYSLLPLLKIIDYPRFPYRGILLDTARHFFTVSEVNSLIDIMAAHKLNALHLHLSDDEAFRVDIPFYPTIREVSSQRKFGLAMGPMMFSQGNLYTTWNNTPFVKANTKYEGIYTASDIVDIIEYANLNQITVIPEIDIPGHARALIKSLPNCFVDPLDKSKYLSVQGYWDNVLPVCTYGTDISVGPEFSDKIDRIIQYIATLFNGQTTAHAVDMEISIGGDEVSTNAWAESKSCQGFWSKLSALEKSHKFFEIISKRNKQLKLSGWQQFVQMGSGKMGHDIVMPRHVGHVWIWDKSEPGISQAVELLDNNFPTVLAFSDKTYFDLVYTPDIHELGFSWATSWSDTNAALSVVVPTNQILEKTVAPDKLMGLEGALWSEHLASYEQLIYMAVPKMAGLAEASWSPGNAISYQKNVNWPSLATRLGCGDKGFLKYLADMYDCKYRGYPKGIHLEVPSEACSRTRLSQYNH